jgi:predicted HTH transcriptional regulator
MIVPKNIADVQKMIQDQVQENIHLDYKRSAAIRRGSRERDEIAKDVSAFANSDGGVLIYGVEEKDQLPIRIDGVDDSESSREWIEATLMTGITPSHRYEVVLPVLVSQSVTLRSIYV